ncbi:SixA phosphatase family protein [Celeribacter neptunius]|uniref:Phosphohistidine phosphatase n=1 Tax=Celeribacter neptunius TaxID=588602 RepID=A0A1I3RBJ1_9RHOB|nr:histidine phosphatase family protein [Celeribacter neptunius]SFJ44014.1 phosphohistidine phosphatase [Celeribacter neptunius]
MPLRLILMRHAKSSWGDPLQEDIDRPLTARGQRNALSMGHWLKERGYIPDHALVSSATRTQQTYDQVCHALGTEPENTLLEALYLASDGCLLRALHRTRGQTVLLIAHNPGIGDFAARFPDKAPDHRKCGSYPTCATTVYELGCEDWRDATWGKNRILDFATPKEIEAGRH